MLKQRRTARLFLLLAERHRANGHDNKLVAALVRAAWRAHEKADTAASLWSPREQRTVEATTRRRFL